MLLSTRAGPLLSRTQQHKSRHSLRPQMMTRLQYILAEAVSKPEPNNDVADVTPREKEVLELVAKGNSTKQIADLLGISIRTVESHRINMLKKLKVNNTAGLIKKAIELKILT